MFSGSASNGASTTTAATQEALVEAAIKAKNLVFYRILIMCCIKRIVHVCNMQCSPNWQEKTMLSDMLSLQQQGLCCKALIGRRITIIDKMTITLKHMKLHLYVKIKMISNSCLDIFLLCCKSYLYLCDPKIYFAPISISGGR